MLITIGSLVGYLIIALVTGHQLRNVFIDGNFQFYLEQEFEYKSGEYPDKMSAEAKQKFLGTIMESVNKDLTPITIVSVIAGGFWPFTIVIAVIKYLVKILLHGSNKILRSSKTDKLLAQVDAEVDIEIKRKKLIQEAEKLGLPIEGLDK